MPPLPPAGLLPRPGDAAWSPRAVAGSAELQAAPVTAIDGYQLSPQIMRPQQLRSQEGKSGFCNE